MSTELAVELAGLFLAPLIIGLFFLAFDKRRESRREATDLFIRYNSKPLLEARAKAWSFLTSQYVEHPMPWSVFYADATERGIDRDPYQEAHDFIVVVAAEWALLGVLFEEKRVDRVLARRLFANQYRFWSVGFRQIRRVTAEAGEVPPMWTDLLDSLDRELLEEGEARPDDMQVMLVSSE